MPTADRPGRIWLVLPLIVYLLLPTRNFYWDGVSFAINVENLSLREALHPNHLIYTLASQWVYRAVLAAGLHVRALFLMQAVNAVLAGGTVVLVYRALRRRLAARGETRSLTVAALERTASAEPRTSVSGLWDFCLGLPGDTSYAVAGALCFAFSATWWRYASDADAYIPAILLMLCANDFLEDGRRPEGAALLHAGAMLFHELAILFLPVALYRLKDRKAGARYCGVSLAPVGVAYWWAYRTVFGRFDVGGFWRWITARSPDASFSFQPVRDLSRTLLGTLRLFFGGRVEYVKGDARTIVAVLGLAVSTGLLVWCLRRSGRWRWVRPPNDLRLWLGVYVVFLFFWMPQNTFYRLFYLVPLVLMVGCSVKAAARQRLLPWLVCGVMVTWNLAFFIYPESRVENNVPLRFALGQKERWPAGTPIAFHRFHPDLWTISYFNPQASWIGMERLDFGLLDRSLTYAHEQGQPLWLEATAYELVAGDSRGREWLASHEVPGGLLVYRDARHEYRFYQTR